MNESSLDRREHAKLMYAQRADHLKDLPPQILFDLARNEAAPRDWRRAALQLLIDHHCPQANHPDLAILAMEIKLVGAEPVAKHDVQAVVESAMEAELPAVGAPSASFTTASLMQDDSINNIVRNPDALNDDALVGE